MERFLKIMFVCMLLVSCNNKSNDVGNVYHKCVIHNIEQLEQSSIDVEKKFIIYTDCGKSITKTNQGLKVGDTIIIRK
jgi:hypothetical protein